MIRKIMVVIFFCLFLSMIPIANYFLLHFGTICQIHEPCIIPVWFHPLVYAPSGVMFAGLSFVLRDILQRLSNVYISLIAVICGTFLSYLYVDPVLAVAGCGAYFLSEISDTVLYTMIQKYNLILAIIISSASGLIIDSLVFLHIAFHSYKYLLGQIIGKSLLVMICIPFIMLNRNLLSKSRLN